MNKLLYESRWSEGKHSPVELAVERKSRFKISEKLNYQNASSSFNDYNNQQGYSVSEQDEHLSRAQRVIPGSCDSCTRPPTRFWSL